VLHPFGEEYNLRGLSLRDFPQLPVTSSPLRSNTFLNKLFSNILNIFSSLKRKDQVSHPYNKTGRIDKVMNIK
jgi:hypothetical protein